MAGIARHRPTPIAQHVHVDLRRRHEKVQIKSQITEAISGKNHRGLFAIGETQVTPWNSDGRYGDFSTTATTLRSSSGPISDARMASTRRPKWWGPRRGSFGRRANSTMSKSLLRRRRGRMVFRSRRRNHFGGLWGMMGRGSSMSMSDAAFPRPSTTYPASYETCSSVQRGAKARMFSVNLVVHGWRFEARSKKELMLYLSEGVSLVLQALKPYNGMVCM